MYRFLEILLWPLSFLLRLLDKIKVKKRLSQAEQELTNIKQLVDDLAGFSADYVFGISMYQYVFLIQRDSYLISAALKPTVEGLEIITNTLVQDNYGLVEFLEKNYSSAKFSKDSLHYDQVTGTVLFGEEATSALSSPGLLN